MITILSIDPVVMAAATVMRLQTIVSRELAAAEAAVVTIGSLQAGTKGRVIRRHPACEGGLSSGCQLLIAGSRAYPAFVGIQSDIRESGDVR
jgi:hypothetical protein